MATILFPHSTIRPIQQDMVDLVQTALKQKKHALIHAPTGIGKTAAILGPVMTHALENGLNVFYLTSRHTQHKIVIDTIKKIRAKADKPVIVADMIGKRWMCLQGGLTVMKNVDFGPFCKSLVEDQKCEFYLNARNKNQPSPRVLGFIEEVSSSGIQTVGEVMEFCKAHELCPYEVSLFLAERANVIVGDYSYIFNPHIREIFLTRAHKELSKSIVIVDEGHNLPGRLRELLSEGLSMITINKAIKEAQEIGSDGLAKFLMRVLDVMEELGDDLSIEEERFITREEFTSKVNGDYDVMVEELYKLSVAVMEAKRTSFAAQVAGFMESWKGDDEGYARILTKKQVHGHTIVNIRYRCLDPALASKSVIEHSPNVFLMSGTLSPLEMYRDLLGFGEDTVLGEFASPFPKENKLHLVITQTTTQYKKRDSAQYENIARVCTEIVNLVPGNVGIFFPSYQIMNDVGRLVKKKVEKTVFEEKQGLQKHEKEDLLERFSSYSTALLLGVSSASFAEGIDLPGVFKAIIVVGIPLQVPDLETKELIKYYDARFERGREYGYIWPAFTRTIQSAGRCIRSEDDRGILVFLDERYGWPSYIKCFPADWDLKISRNYKEEVGNFFKNG